MKVITPGVIGPKEPEVFRASCYKCHGTVEYDETELRHGPSLGDRFRVICPTPGCKTEILHDVLNNVKYTEEERHRLFMASLDHK